MSSPRLLSILLAALVWFGAPQTAVAQGSQARLDAAATSVHDLGRRSEVTLGLTAPVPWRLTLRDGPPRLLLDFQGLDLGATGQAALQISDTVAAARTGFSDDGWARLVLELARPMAVTAAAMDTSGAEPRLRLTLRQTSAAAFAALAEPAPAATQTAPEAANRPFRVVIDPGHGGVDPGAEAGGVNEADLMLTFAQELGAVLSDAGIEAILTRQSDTFVSLEARVRIARRAGAGLFISLHADALEEGNASGTTVYTLADEAVDEATQKLTERHESGDLLGGVTLEDSSDELARVLVDIARTETRPRTHALADALVGMIDDQVGGLHKQPLRTADFSVLKSPDIPAVLVELGFLSNARDLKRIKSADWRAKMQQALRDGIIEWRNEDALRTALTRQ
ncbi:MAG: AMIN domain-containing protein [Rhodobacteraceae bacterium]|nr:AMIN domain-containing protein [Paracoccaceae bacterium]